MVAVKGGDPFKTVKGRNGKERLVRRKEGMENGEGNRDEMNRWRSERKIGKKGRAMRRMKR